MVARGWGKGEWELLFNGYSVSFARWVLEMKMEMVTQQYECT